MISKLGRIEREKRMVELMIRLHCRGKHHKRELCQECHQLLEYAHSRLNRCPYEESKSSCKKCTNHCYRPEMRSQIRAVMRYSGPRMIIKAPLETLRHYLCK